MSSKYDSSSLLLTVIHRKRRVSFEIYIKEFISKKSERTIHGKNNLRVDEIHKRQLNVGRGTSGINVENEKNYILVF
jgi:hypothetical protein